MAAALDRLADRLLLARDEGRQPAPLSSTAACGHLDGPLCTLRHLMTILQSDPANPPLVSGEIVTTGTLTSAMPILRGERWSTALKGIAFGDASLDFT